MDDRNWNDTPLVHRWESEKSSFLMRKSKSRWMQKSWEAEEDEGLNYTACRSPRCFMKISERMQLGKLDRSYRPQRKQNQEEIEPYLSSLTARSFKFNWKAVLSAIWFFRILSLVSCDPEMSDRLQCYECWNTSGVGTETSTISQTECNPLFLL